MARKRKTPKRNSKGRFVKGSGARRKTTRRRTAARRATARKNPSTKRKAAARKAVATRKRNARKRSEAARKAARTRRRTTTTRRRNPATARRPRGAARSYARRRNPAPKRRRAPARRYRRNPASKPRYYRTASGKVKQGAGVKSLASARRTIKYQRKHPSSPAATGFLRRFKMRSNPGTIVEALGSAIPVAGALYGSRFITNRLGPQIPFMDRLGAFAAPAQAGAVFLGLNYLTAKVAPLRQFRSAAVIGSGINIVDSLVQSFAPPSVKRAVGLRKAPAAAPELDDPEAQDGIYDRALGEYVEVGEYLGVGSSPLDTDLALSSGMGEYVSVGAIEQELGALESELGMEADLGRSGLGAAGGRGRGFDDRRLGGVSRGSLQSGRIPRMASKGAIPRRSFTKEVEPFDEAQNAPGRLYTGVFGGGSSIGG